jgi:hypothetical protein
MQISLNEFEREFEALLQAVKEGKRIVVNLGKGDVEVVREVRKGWSEEILKHLHNPDPDWHLRPDPFPRKISVTRRDPFTEDNY